MSSSAKSSKQLSHRIEFIGGPFDGYVEPLASEPAFLPEHLHCFISENTFRRLYGQSEMERYAITSIAIYIRLLHGNRWAYFFVEAVPPDSIAIQSGSNGSE